jgi:hypothetical protein
MKVRSGCRETTCLLVDLVCRRIGEESDAV